jgi:hypothetical protein
MVLRASPGHDGEMGIFLKLLWRWLTRLMRRIG